LEALPVTVHFLTLTIAQDGTFSAKCACGRMLAEGEFIPREVSRDIWLTQVGAVTHKAYEAHVKPLCGKGPPIGPSMVGTVCGFTIYVSEESDAPRSA
jgi:hypothetical protein